MPLIQAASGAGDFRAPKVSVAGPSPGASVSVMMRTLSSFRPAIIVPIVSMKPMRAIRAASSGR